jgi:hypothetical protein
MWTGQVRVRFLEMSKIISCFTWWHCHMPDDGEPLTVFYWINTRYDYKIRRGLVFVIKTNN